MTKTTAAPEVTVDYKSDSPTGTDRVRVELVGGSVASDDLYQLLLRRLRLVFAIQAVAAFVATLELLPAPWDGPEPDGEHGSLVRLFVEDWPWLLLVAVSAASALFLWKRPPASIAELRRIELLVLGGLVVVLLQESVGPPYRFLEDAAVEPARTRKAFVHRYAVTGSLAWSLVLVAYGAFIPNTRERSATVVGVIGLSPVALFCLFGLWLRPLELGIFLEVLFIMGLNLGVAAAVAVFAAARIEVLRQQAAQARALGQYVLGEKLGAGGMGEVYRAEHVLLRRPCALKLIRPERARDPKNLRRFEREVRATAALTHPNTVQIYDYGHAADGTFYYVMEYLAGPNLEQLVKHHGPLSPERAVHLLRQLCGALQEAHAVGLIHRDIKPSNIIVCERGGIRDVAKLLDFGIVDAPDAGPDNELTAQGQVLGTPGFMSTEQAAGLPNLDARSDLYSLGATAYFVLTGKAPFERPTPMLTITAHLRDPLTPPHYLRTEIPRDLSAVIARCLEKDPAQRHQDAAALEKALSECRCANQPTGDRAGDAAQVQPNGDQGPRPDTTSLERRWGF